MPSLVAIDIETTGLDPNNDAIIEIGAVRFNGPRIEDEWSTLIHPGRPIPSFISQLTGITNDMVRHAPSIREVIADLAQFVGDAPVLGHNVSFDLAFLNRQNLLRFNQVVDTYELASVLMPNASRYNLGALGQTLGILLPATHRALDDARVTHAVYLRLLDLAHQLPIELIAEFVRQSEPFDWGAAYTFREVLRSLARKPIPARKAQDQGLFLFRPEPPLPPVESVETPIPLDVDEVAALLEYGGPFSRYFSGYEYRQQQVEMLRAVAQALSKGQHLMVEAGTGTGKSFAYLVPAALFALQNNTRVVISTNTINLQDQLIKKDIPDLREALGIDLRAAVLKGRNNYLCPRRLENLRQRGPTSVDEMRVLAKVLTWLQFSDSGDRNEINLNGPIERDVWSRISAEDEGCKAEVCMERTGGACPFYRARQAAQSAHLLVVNHALLLSDVATGSRVLPDYDYLIVDEAHHLEAATTSALSFRVTQADLARLLRELGGTNTGILGRLLLLLNQLLRPSDFAAMQQAFERATDLIFRLEHAYSAFFRAMEEFLAEIREGRPVGAYGQQERILESSRTLPPWTNIEITWDAAHEVTGLLSNLLAELYKTCGELRDTASDEFEDTLESLANVYRRLMEADANLHAFVAQPQQSSIYWAEISPNSNQLSLQIAPLHIGPLMEEYIWHEKTSVILTSATLTTHEGFDYLRSRLAADEAEELQLGSPFDYESAALLYLVNDIPEPGDTNGHQRAIEQALVRLARATGGRMLALFTSYTQLRRTSQNISAPLIESGIIVYEQGEGASPNTLLENFREADKAVLLGTRSFWEGVDIPGEALSVLVIVKLPFDVPSDPIIAARSETFDDPFNEYQLPEAILRFRQGFGRLIRTQSDRGIVAILDRRILTKRYGRAFLESLPPCTRKIGSVNDLPAIAARWLNL
ncbi:MAG TPA: DNA polymerase III subunit epsilon [Anaerolinea thermolimosa]|uniref:3'-5' exonuclease DinG n=1 Tax=Anaerolinea thermolimosa TaxID=229919 RepID=A0A3D1JHQ8_9CHLR|nr:helicase C-terminal domain-containing protein [Anaerolinea thermolimosa]GAP07043.1 DnaQ family exonuclease [Anaerolinea thermolimosa]HCE18109.1 DNA polymerase III subunit epsilon [Anaerolinea thermolimosa]